MDGKFIVSARLKKKNGFLEARNRGLYESRRRFLESTSYDGPPAFFFFFLSLIYLGGDEANERGRDVARRRDQRQVRDAVHAEQRHERVVAAARGPQAKKQTWIRDAPTSQRGAPTNNEK
jgi:hypothetical protein